MILLGEGRDDFKTGRGRPVRQRAKVLLKVGREFGKSIEWLLTGDDEKRTGGNDECLKSV
jgi:hypothetical protein